MGMVGFWDGLCYGIGSQIHGVPNLVLLLKCMHFCQYGLTVMFHMLKMAAFSQTFFFGILKMEVSRFPKSWM